MLGSSGERSIGYTGCSGQSVDAGVHPSSEETVIKKRSAIQQRIVDDIDAKWSILREAIQIMVDENAELHKKNAALEQQAVELKVKGKKRGLLS